MGFKPIKPVFEPSQLLKSSLEIPSFNQSETAVLGPGSVRVLSLLLRNSRPRDTAVGSMVEMDMLSHL